MGRTARQEQQQSEDEGKNGDIIGHTRLLHVVSRPVMRARTV
jgi:hypothetical protein